LVYFFLQSITFEQFRIQAGSDSTGVATDMISVNSTVKMTYRNKGTFFGVRVTSTPLDLSYSEITIASGNVSQFRSLKKTEEEEGICGFFSNLVFWYCRSRSFTNQGRARDPWQYLSSATKYHCTEVELG
jgi:hypothetical protein